MAAPHPVYHRTPLPAAARPRTGWLALCWMLVIGSPFVGFALHGRVAEPGLRLGAAFALLPLAAMALLWRQRRAGWRQLPPELARQWQLGRWIEPHGAPDVAAPLRYADARHWIELRADGVLAARSALLAVDSGDGLRDRLHRLRGADAAGQYFVPWADMACWEVATDSDGPDPHRLRLRGGGCVRLRRFIARDRREADLLDGVRAIGRVPLRLRDDLPAG